MGLDRALAPPQGGVGTLPRYSEEQGRLGNGVESRLLRSEGLGVAMLQLFFPRGAAHMKAPAVGRVALKSLLKGSRRLDEAELNDYFDHRGSLVSFTLLPDYVEARVVALAEHFVDSARCMLEVLETPTFPPRALESVGGQLQQQYEFRELETAHNAQCALRARLFPPAPGDEAGGYASSIHSEDFAGISRDHILDFHRRAFATQGAMLFLSGDVSPRSEAAILSRVESLLLPSEPGYSQLELSMPELESKGATARADGGWGGVERIAMRDKLQSSIYVGCRLPILGAGITAANPLLRQAVALFGGYFTSRLMQNLREDKGYTYSVQAWVLEHALGAALLVSTDVGHSYEEAAMAEIQHEMLRMRSEPPSEEELLNLKGYLQNSLLSGFKSPISASLTLRRLRLYPWLGEGYFDNLIDSIARLNGSSLLRECCQFFSPERYTVVVAGQPQ